jgi:alcohol dehydrogenase (cytochrome c)
MASALRRTAGFALAAATLAALPLLAQNPPPASAPDAGAAAILRSYQPVTAARLLEPEDGNWLMIRRTYDGWGYSPLEQITTSNVAGLKPVWSMRTGVDRVHEAAPLVNNGVMFVSTPANQVLALEAATGRVLWRYVRPRPAGVFVLHDTNRGVALLGDRLYYAAAEAVLVALDVKTGKEVWATTVADNSSAYYLTLAPLVAQGKVLVGASGGEFGVRGFIAAFDAATGKEAWRTYTVPAPGEPGSETWPKGEQWKTGGAPVWVTGNYDPETNLAFFGTGNGGPWMGDQRPGDNLYVGSTVAVDVATGRIKGHFQYNPNESWDWDEVSPPIVVDYRRGGRTIKGLVNVARNGYIWFLERTAGPIRFVDGTPFVTNNVYRRLDPKTGRPDVDPARKPGTGRTAEFCPSPHGGKNWPPIAFSPKTRMIYIPANNNICGTLTGVPVQYSPGRSFSGAMSGRPFAAPGAKHVGGEVQAWNVDTGRRVWVHEYDKTPNWGSMLATGGGLVFTGGTNDRKVHAFDASTGKLLWEVQTSSGIVAPPTTFMVGGRQYLAVHSGWGGDPRGMQNTLNRIFPGQYPPVPEGGSITVYALDAR